MQIVLDHFMLIMSAPFGQQMIFVGKCQGYVAQLEHGWSLNMYTGRFCSRCNIQNHGQAR